MTQKEKLDKIRGDLQPIVNLIDIVDNNDFDLLKGKLGYLIKDCKDSVNKIAEREVFKLNENNGKI